MYVQGNFHTTFMVFQHLRQIQTIKVRRDSLSYAQFAPLFMNQIAEEEWSNLCSLSRTCVSKEHMGLTLWKKAGRRGLKMGASTCISEVLRICGVVIRSVSPLLTQKGICRRCLQSLFWIQRRQIFHPPFFGFICSLYDLGEISEQIGHIRYSRPKRLCIFCSW